jgi:hypothetical protein
MPITNGYCTLAEIKTELGITDTQDDTFLEGVVNAVSREIDAITHRRFYAATQTRFFTPEWSDLLLVDDLLTVTTLKTDEDGDGIYEITWLTSDYLLEPYNAPSESQAEPYTQIRRAPNGRYWFPAGGARLATIAGSGLAFWRPDAPIRAPVAKGVEIAGSWGFSSATPPVVNKACLIQGARVAKRRDAPFGVAGFGEFGHSLVIAKLDPDVRLLLDSVTKKSA